MQTSEIKIVGDVRLLPLPLAATTLGISERTFEVWRREGRAPPITKIGRDVYVEESSLATWIRSQEQAA
jgi:predicted DNA-binding transcriptional regulator AlpA